MISSNHSFEGMADDDVLCATTVVLEKIGFVMKDGLLVRHDQTYGRSLNK